MVVEAHPHQPAELHLAAQPPQADVLLAQPVLIPLLLAADIDAVSLQVILPCMEHAGHPLRVSRRLPFEEAAGRTPLDDHAAMRAHVEERAHLVVGAAANDDRLARDADGAEVVRTGELRLVADRNPHALENIGELVLENPRVGIDTAVHPLAELELRVGEPLLVILRRHFSPPVFPSPEGADYKRDSNRSIISPEQEYGIESP